MKDQDKQLFIQVLLEEYKSISSDIQIFSKEMVKCLVYGAILVALYLGWGVDAQTQTPGFSSKIREYVPYGFIVLAVYFLSLAYIKIGLSRHRASLEREINRIAGVKLLSWESYVSKIQSTGFIRLGTAWYARVPTPMLFLGFLVAATALLVFSLGKISEHKIIIVFSFFIIGLASLYVFFIYPKLADRAKDLVENIKTRENTQ